MNWDPRLTQMRAELSYDLGRVAAWCRHKHPDTPPHTLVAAAAVIVTANGALSTLGHFTTTTGARWISPGIVIFAAEISAHDRIAAVRHFHDIVLST